jgi:methylenetetrahydrofolate reductase (NADPH)
MAELIGADVPAEITRKISAVSESDVPKVGIEIATELSEKLLGLGAPGLHFYTMNNSGATIEIVKNLNIAK